MAFVMTGESNPPVCGTLTPPSKRLRMAGTRIGVAQTRLRSVRIDMAQEIEVLEMDAHLPERANYDWLVGDLDRTIATMQDALTQMGEARKLLSESQEKS